MIINTSKSPVIVGRFRILPGDKFPDVPKTAQESNAVETLMKKGIFKELAPAQPVKTAVAEQPAKSPSRAKEPKNEPKNEQKPEQQKPEPAKTAQAGPEQEKPETK